jgi:hypothetical protein
MPRNWPSLLAGFSTPAVAGGSVYVGSFDRRVYALATRL